MVAAAEFAFIKVRFAAAPGTAPRATTSTAATFAADHSHVFANDLELVVLLAVLLPRIQLEPPFNQDRGTLGEILGSDFRGSAPEGDVHESHFLDPFPLLVFPLVVDREADVGHRQLTAGVPQLHVAGQVSHQDYSVKAGHNFVLGEEQGFK